MMLFEHEVKKHRSIHANAVSVTLFLISSGFFTFIILQSNFKMKRFVIIIANGRMWGKNTDTVSKLGHEYAILNK